MVIIAIKSLEELSDLNNKNESNFEIKGDLINSVITVKIDKTGIWAVAVTALIVASPFIINSFRKSK